MPDTGLPQWARVIGRSLRVTAYVLVIVVACGDVLWPSTTVQAVPGLLLAVTDGAMATLGAVGVLGTLAHRWRVEWVCAAALTSLLLGRAGPVWTSVDDVPTRLAAAAMMTLAAVLMACRALDLTVFHVKTLSVASGRRRRRRRRGRAA